MLGYLSINVKNSAVKLILVDHRGFIHVYKKIIENVFLILKRFCKNITIKHNYYLLCLSLNQQAISQIIKPKNHCHYAPLQTRKTHCTKQTHVIIFQLFF